MSQQIGVDCRFREDGMVRVRRVKVGDEWITVEQGRQWRDDAGRHTLIMLRSGRVHEIVLRASTLTWELVPRQSPDIEPV